MKSLLMKTFVLVVWATALFAVLRIGTVTEQGAHAHNGISVCGPWGCGPPVRALLGWHGFWLVLVVLPVGLLIRSWPAGRLKLFGAGLTAVGILALIGIGIYEAATWTPPYSGGEQSYFIQRYLSSVATLTDIPVVPVTLAGLAMWLGGFIRVRATAVFGADRNDSERELPASTEAADSEPTATA